MNIESILELLDANEISIGLKDGSLAVRGKKGEINSETLLLLKNNKPLLIEWLKSRESVVRPLVKSHDRGARPPLSFSQQRLWMLDKINPESNAYNIPEAFRLIGDVNITALKKAFDLIIERHEILRTIYKAEDGAPYQVVLPADEFSMDVVDLSELSEKQCKDQVSALSQYEVERIFDLSSDVMFVVKLLKLKKNDFILLLTMHHIASDGWSLGVLLNELSALYNAFTAGLPNPLDNLDIQYIDYVYWEHEWLTKEVLQKDLDYWSGYLQGIPVVHQIPLDKPRPAQQSYKGNYVDSIIKPALQEKLYALAKQNGCTLFMVLHAAISTLLSKYSGEKDIVIGCPIANRGQAEVASLIGFFANTLVLRSDFTGDLSFNDVLEQSKKSLLNAYEHQQLPFERLVDELHVGRGLSHSPIFQILIALQNHEEGSLSFDGIESSVFREQLYDISKFDMSLYIGDRQDGLNIRWEYSTNIFEEKTIVLMAQHLEVLIESVVLSPTLKLSQLSLLTAAEKNNFQEYVAQAIQKYPEEFCAHELFEQQVELSPDAIALTCGDASLTYSQLNEKSNRLACYLIDNGVGPESLVGICIDRSLEMVVAILGIMKAGCAYVPLDPHYPIARLEYILNDAHISLIIGEATLEEKFVGKGNWKFIGLDSQNFIDLVSGYAKSNIDRCLTNVTPNNLAYVIYTSGSTGNPKGVMVEHSNLTRLLFATSADFSFNANDVWTLFHSYAFDFSVWEMWGALAYGGRLVIIPQWVARSPNDFYDVLVNQCVTVLNQTPSAFKQLIEVDGMRCQSLSLRVVIFGGEALALKSLIPWVERHGDATPQLVNMYGITETTVHVTYRLITSNDIYFGAGSVIGRAIDDLKIFILDENQHPVPVGVSGEIYVSGKGVARGYLHNPQLTAERFVQNPFVNNAKEKVYRSGDLARYLKNGDLEYLGRIDQQVKIRGFRIELGEIENKLLSFEYLREAVVVPYENLSGHNSLIAYVVMQPVFLEMKSNENMAASLLRSHLLSLMPEHMVPSMFILMDKLPLTVNGKIDKKSLPKPDISQQLINQYVAPENSIEEKLCEVWAQVLGLEKVGTQDNFFAVGGDSIKAITVIACAAKAGFPLSVKDIFSHQTIADLTKAIVSNTTKCESVDHIPAFSMLSAQDRESIKESHLLDDIEDAYPLSMLQQGMIFHSLMDAGLGMYHDIFGYAIKEQWNYSRFATALECMVKKHESLRRIFIANGDRPLQIILNEAHILPHVIDISDMDEGQQSAQLEQWMLNEKKNDFILGELPWRVFIHIKRPDEFIFHLSFHHALLDGWSVASLVSNLINYYVDYQQHNLIQNNSKHLPYKNFIAMEQAIINSAAAKSYWTNKLVDVTLPWWAGFKKRGSIWHDVVISTEASKCLTGIAMSLGVQEKSVLLSVHMVLMSLLGGQLDVVSSIVSNGRIEAEGGEATLGLFLNSLPVREKITNSSWKEIILRINSELLDQSDFRRYPLANIQHDLGLDFSASLFNFTNFHVFSDLQEKVNINVYQLFEESNYLFISYFSKRYGSDNFNLELVADISAFDKDFLERAGGYVNNIINEIISDINKPIEVYEIIGQKELTLQKNIYAGKTSDYPRNSLIHEIFEAEAEAMAFPDSVALVSGDVSLSYRELNEKANRLAHYLQAQDVEPGNFIALCIDRSAEMVIGLLAILKAGAAYVPIDTAYPISRIQHIVSDSGVSIMLTQRTFEHYQLLNESIKLVLLDDEKLHQDLNAYSSTNPKISIPSIQRPAYVIYTSGTTGMPKGVIVEHRAVLRLVKNNNYVPLTSHTIMLQAASIAFDAATFECWGALLNGSRLILSPGPMLDVSQLGALITQSNVNTLWMTAGLFDQFVESWSESLANVHYLLVGGDIVSPSTVTRLLAQYPDINIINGYGPTENTTFSCCYKIPANWRADDALPIGSAITNSQVYVLNPAQQLLPLQVPGELYVGGDGLALEYLHQPELTKQKFIPNPFSTDPAARLYKTGDLVKWRADGNLDFLGRLDQQVKIRGFRVELREIEMQLLALVDIAEAVVIVSGKDRSSQRIVAYVVPAASGKKNISLIENVRNHLKQNLPDYMMPADYMVLDFIPLTNNGKIDRKALPIPNFNCQDFNEYEEPRNKNERILCEIWRNVLALPKVGITNNFFELGGHSLSIVRVIGQLKAQGYTISAAEFYKSPTIAQLAPMLAASTININTSNEQGLVLGKAPVLPNNYWFFQRRDLNHWNASCLLEVVLPYHQNIIKNAIAILLQHHDVLRSVWVQDNDEWQQSFRLLSDMEPWWNVIDLSKITDERMTEEIENRCRAEQESLDIKKILFRVVYFELGNGRNARVMLVIHHLLMDSYSYRVLLQDLDALCRNDKQDAQSILPPKTTSVKTLAETYCQHINHPDIQDELEYWRSRPWHKYKHLPKESSESELLPNTGTSFYRLVWGRLTREETQRFEALPGKADFTLEDILLTALVLAYGSWAGSKSLCLCLANHGRTSLPDESIDLSRTIGWLGNYAMRMFDLGDDQTLFESLQSIKQQRDSMRGKEGNYSVLRFMHPDPLIRQEMDNRPSPQIDQNFFPREEMAKLEKNEKYNSGFRVAKESMGSNESAMGSLFRPFSNAHFDKDTDCFCLYWAYCPSMYTERTIGWLADYNMQAIRLLIEVIENNDTSRKYQIT